MSFQWFLDKTGHEGLNNLLAAYPDKSAYAQCIFSFCLGPDDEPKVFVGRTHGKIVPARGPLDFGYIFIWFLHVITNFCRWDPVFQPDGQEGTYAELSKEVKNSISHRFLSTFLICFSNLCYRYLSLDELRKYLIENENDIYAKLENK